MKKTILAVAMASTLLVPAAQALELKTEEQKVSYSLGLIIGEKLKRDAVNLDQAAFQSAIQAVYAGDEPLMNREEMAQTMQAFQQKKAEEERLKKEKLIKENFAKGQAFLAENGKKAGVKTTESGLQYEELNAGSGKQPTEEDTVKVHYRGTLIDGTEFDSSYARNEPVAFPLKGVIPGWTEGLQLMKEGGKARLVIPSELAYGPGGMGNAIGPNETLVFEVELLEVNPKEEE